MSSHTSLRMWTERDVDFLLELGIAVEPDEPD